MPKASSTSNSKVHRSRSALLLTAALIVVIETVLAFLPQNKLVKNFRADTVPGRAPDWEIFGDSVAQSGLVAQKIAAALPPDTVVHNAAIAGTGPEFPYFILQRQIALGKTPKAIIYAPSPHTFASTRVALVVGGYARWPEIAKIAALGVATPEVAYGVLCKLSYTLRYREELGDLLKGRRPDAEEQKAAPPGKPSPAKRFTVASIHPMYKKPFNLADFNAPLLHKFLSLAAEHNVPVYWLTMPVMPAVYESRAPVNFDADYFRFLDSLQQQHGIRFLQREFLIWDEAGFKDMTHLNAASAERLSQLVGEKLSALEKNPAR